MCTAKSRPQSILTPIYIYIYFPARAYIRGDCTRTMPKKQQRNAFYYFMIDKQQQLREQGKIVSLKDMPIIASAEWNVSRRCTTSHVPLLERSC